MILELLLFLALMALLFKISRPPPGLPPGLWGLPFIGTIPDTSVPFKDYIHNLANQYGDIFHIKTGQNLMIFISDFAMAKKAFSGADAVDRPHLFTLRIFTYFKDAGFLATNGELWHSNRKSSLRYLKDFGMGKTSLQDTVQDEAKAFLKDLEENVGKPIELEWNLNLAILNVIWKIVADRRYETSDKKIQDFAKLLSGDFDTISGPVQLLDSFPFLIPLLPTIIKNKWMKVDKLERNRDLFYSFIMEEIEEHRKSIDLENPRDLIDCFLIEMKDEIETEDEDKYLNLFAILGDMFIAGQETTSSTIRWFTLYMVLYPEVQARIQEEIDNSVGTDRQPELGDRESLKYLEAAIHEVHRKASLVPFSLPHQATKEMDIGGYTIPKGTILMLLLSQTHNDPRYWEKPDMFYPEHFLDENGKLLTKRDGFLPFSIGRRQCLGESLARMELFLFCSAMLQKFQIFAEPGQKLSTEADPTKQFILSPQPFKVIFKRRH